MNPREAILKLVARAGSVTGPEVAKALGISRQAAARHMRRLVAERRVLKTGTTRAARYTSARGARPVAGRSKKFFATYGLRRLDEAAVFGEIALRMGLSARLSPKAYRIAAYAFTEMLNNAIDHSGAKTAEVTVECGGDNFSFAVRDRGVGVFESLCRKFRLRDHFEAVEHLLKGKQSADPVHHSGQGIFFTSKIADEFSLESASHRLVIDNRIDDAILKDARRLAGTRVRFVLNRRSRKDLKQLFDAYTNSDFEFDRTRIRVRLSGHPGENISRSQARRLLFGLDAFKRITLDFKGVDGVGQGFADEVFRVFAAAHPDIRIDCANMSPSVEFMVRRAIAPGPPGGPS